LRFNFSQTSFLCLFSKSLLFGYPRFFSEYFLDNGVLLALRPLSLSLRNISGGICFLGKVDLDEWKKSLQEQFIKELFDELAEFAWLGIDLVLESQRQLENDFLELVVNDLYPLDESKVLVHNVFLPGFESSLSFFRFLLFLWFTFFSFSFLVYLLGSFFSRWLLNSCFWLLFSF